MRQFKVVRRLSDTRLNSIYPKNTLWDKGTHKLFEFPPVGTILSSNERGYSVFYNGHFVCDIGSNMQKLCLEEV